MDFYILGKNVALFNRLNYISQIFIDVWCLKKNQHWMKNYIYKHTVWELYVKNNILLQNENWIVAIYVVALIQNKKEYFFALYDLHFTWMCFVFSGYYTPELFKNMDKYDKYAFLLVSFFSHYFHYTMCVQSFCIFKRQKKILIHESVIIWGTSNIFIHCMSFYIFFL